MPATDGTWRSDIADDTARGREVAYGLLASVILLLFVGCFLIARRAVGTVTVPLPPHQLVLTALVLVAWTWTSRVLWLRFAQPLVALSPAAERQIALWLPVAVVCLFAAACSFPCNRAVDWLVWLPAVAIVTVPRFAAGPARRGSPAIAIDRRQEIVLQQLTRVRTADGVDVIRGTFTSEFPPGEKNATLHVAFCPPFERLPHVEAKATDETLATVKLAQVLHNGVQLDVRLAETSDIALSVPVELRAAGL